MKNSKISKPVLIVGAGFSGAVLARQLAEAGINCRVIDSRDHIAGNCHTARDPETGVMEHKYGPHIFNTSNQRVWDYIQRFGRMMPFVNHVMADTERGVFSLPINLLTINQFFGTKFSPAEAQAFLATKGDQSIEEPQNFEEQALKFLGAELYYNFFHGYTKKQWGCEPTELPASILKRLPVRFNYDSNYYTAKYQGIPEHGYSAIVENLLNHECIEVKLNTAFETSMHSQYSDIFYCGPIDHFYDCCHGRLGYRTVYFEKKVYEGDYQGNVLMNYPSLKVPHTRVHEHKHFAPWEQHDKTLVVTEYSKETEVGDTPYYPKHLKQDKEILEKYLAMARQESHMFFMGRLGTYRYLDMHVVIDEALRYADHYIEYRAGNVEAIRLASELPA